jgi:transcription elongation factor GreA
MATESDYNSNSNNLSLGESATKYLINLSSDDRQKAQQEIYKFVRWYGEDRLISELTIPEVANYTEQISSSTIEAEEKLKNVKSFLSYAYKHGFIKTKLAVHIKVKKAPAKSLSAMKWTSQKSISLTAQGYADLEAELTALINERPRVAAELKKAAADKDFRENSPLDAVREYQGQIEARIRELEATLKMATIMDEKQSNNQKIGLGNTVVLKDLVTGDEILYTLVDASEANPTKGKISIVSPIGKALLGSKKGDNIEVIAPVGALPYKIEDIKQD